MSFALQQPGLLRAQAHARRFDPHLHSTYSIVALKQGLAEIKSARWSATAHARDVFFFNPYEVHSAYCPMQDAEYGTLYLSKGFLAQCLALDPNGGQVTIDTSILGPNSATTDLLDALFTPELNENHIEASLRRVLNVCAFSINPDSDSTGALVWRACLLIQKNCTRAITTEELARELGVHKSHFVRAFSKTVGIAPQSYLRQVRVSKARELICEGMELSTIAFLLDFSDQAHLTREFKKVFGVPPGSLSRDIRTNRRNKGGLDY